MNERLFLMADIPESKLEKIQNHLRADGYETMKIAKQSSGTWAVAACKCGLFDDDED
jgi:hypothetical protein